jgi:hypothetical protein
LHLERTLLARREPVTWAAARYDIGLPHFVIQAGVT